METIEKQENIETIKSPPSVHGVLAHSYFMTLLLFFLGTVLDLIFQFKIFKHNSFFYIGLFLMIFATLLVFWAQHTSHKLKKQNITKEAFQKGPYAFTRTPTHWGMLFLTFGFGIGINAFFIVLTSIIAFLISKFYFIKQEEEILTTKYGNPFTEYKKIVKF